MAIQPPSLADAIDSAKAKGIDVVLVDTAGRMQNKTNLMNELNKVQQTNPHLTLFVGDSLAGNDAVEQAKMFQEIMRFDGAVLTKMDTDAKGGAGLSIAYATGRPIVFAGTGQGYDDLSSSTPIGCSTNSSNKAQGTKTPVLTLHQGLTCLPTKTLHAFSNGSDASTLHTFQMGYLPDQAGQYHYNMAEAREGIEVLRMFQRKTDGNLNAQETQMLRAQISELQMQFTQAPQRRRVQQEEEG